MEIYLFFISKEEISYLMEKSFYIGMTLPTIEQDDQYVLYGYTSDKTLSEEWIRDRSNSFILHVVRESKKYYNSLKSTFPTLEISWIKMHNRKKNVKILSTYFELECVQAYWKDFVLEDPSKVLDTKSLSLLTIENKKIIERLGLTTIFKISHGLSNKEILFWEVEFPLPIKEINLFFHIFHKLLK